MPPFVVSTGGTTLGRRRLQILGIFAALFVIGVPSLFRCSTPQIDYTHLWVFHWVPGSTNLEVIGGPPYVDHVGDSVEGILNPQLLSTLREKGILGQLRLVDRLPIDRLGKSRQVIMLFRSQQQLPAIIDLIDCETAIYCEQERGFDAYPGKASPLGIKMNIAQAKDCPPGHLELSTRVQKYYCKPLNLQAGLETTTYFTNYPWW